MARARARGVTAASIVGWSNDLLPEILVYLPVKSLLRFKLVCKKWNLIISDVSFAVNQFSKTHNSSTPAGLFVYDRMEEHKTVSLPVFQNPPGTIPPLSLQHKLPSLDLSWYERHFYSCNGLLLCVFSPVGLSLRLRRCAVYNPTTGDIKLLPDLPDLGTRMVSYNGFTLVFNPFESHHYSVAVLRRDRILKPQSKLGSSKLYIYSSKTQCWEVSCMIHKIEQYTIHTGVFLNGTIYWLGEKFMHCYNINSQQVVSLDLPSEVLRLGWSPYFMGDHSYIILRLKQGFKFFEFDHVNMKWSNPHTLLLNSDNFGTNPKARALAVVRGKENKDLLFLFSIFPDTLMIYDLVLHKLVERHAVKILRAYICGYVPSLIPVL